MYPASTQPSEAGAEGSDDQRLVALREEHAEPLTDIEDELFARFIDRFGRAKVILLGASTHGTDEFYRARATVTRSLVEQNGFSIVTVEADWPDAVRLDA